MRLSLDHDTLRIELSWWQRLLAAHPSTLAIPLDHIERADTERVATHWGEIRFPGSFIPWGAEGGHLPESGSKGLLVRHWRAAGAKAHPEG